MSIINNASDITKIICNKKLSPQDVQRPPISNADIDHDYILDKIEQLDHIEYER